MRRYRWVSPTLLSFALSACATMSPEESAIRQIMWGVASGCASGTATITVTQIDSYGRVWYSLAQGGQQDVPAFNRCYEEGLRNEFQKRPDLLPEVRRILERSR